MLQKFKSQITSLNKFKKILNNEKGFSLLEIIISVAALAFVSGFILQMFLVSNNVNIKSGDIDSANSEVFSSVELFKKQTNADMYYQEDFLSGCAIVKNGGNTTVYKLYNEKFGQIPISEYDESGMPENTKFVMEIKIARNPPETRDLNHFEDAGHLDTIAVSVKAKDSEGGFKQIVSLDANKFFLK